MIQIIGIKCLLQVLLIKLPKVFEWTIKWIILDKEILSQCHCSKTNSLVRNRDEYSLKLNCFKYVLMLSFFLLLEIATSFRCQESLWPGYYCFFWRLLLMGAEKNTCTLWLPFATQRFCFAYFQVQSYCFKWSKVAKPGLILSERCNYILKCCVVHMDHFKGKFHFKTTSEVKVHRMFETLKY